MTKRMLRRRIARCGRGDGLERIRVQDVVQIPSGDQQVLIAIQVDVHEYRAPSPFARRDPAEGSDLGVGAIAAIQSEGIAQEFGAEIRIIDRGIYVPHALRIGALPLPGDMVAAEHVGHEEIVVTVAIDIGHIGGHRGHAHVTPRQLGLSPTYHD